MQLLVCPVCRARLVGDEPHDQPCRRCASDLSLIRRAYEQARRWRRRARRALADRRHEEALDAARRAVASVDVEETRRTLSAALLAVGRPSAALAVLERR